MPVPKRKRSHSRKTKRNANKGVKVKAITGCQNCHVPIAPHQACHDCGFYKGIKVMTTKADRAVKRGNSKQVLAARAKQKQESVAAEASQQS